MHHSGGVIGYALVIVLLLFLSVRLARSFRRTNRMLKRPDYWDPANGPDPSRPDGHQHAPGRPDTDGSHSSHTDHTGFTGDHGGGSSGGGGDAGGGHHG
jgi:uncharacterized membrane protein YgcG